MLEIIGGCSPSSREDWLAILAGSDCRWLSWPGAPSLGPRLTREGLFLTRPSPWGKGFCGYWLEPWPVSRGPFGLMALNLSFWTPKAIVPPEAILSFPISQPMRRDGVAAGGPTPVPSSRLLPSQLPGRSLRPPADSGVYFVQASVAI